MCALNDRTIMCRSGSAADTEALAGYVRNIVSQHEMELDEIADVKTVATIANQIGYQNKGANRGRGLSAYTIVGPPRLTVHNRSPIVPVPNDQL